MIDPKKRIRQVLFSIHKLSYRIKEVKVDKKDMDKKAFIEVIQQLRKIEDRRDFITTEIGMDMTAYEDDFFAVIENLFKIVFNTEQLELIQMYLYQLAPDKEWDGKITVEVSNGTEETLSFKTPTQVWNVINKFK